MFKSILGLDTLIVCIGAGAIGGAIGMGAVGLMAELLMEKWTFLYFSFTWPKLYYTVFWAACAGPLMMIPLFTPLQRALVASLVPALLFLQNESGIPAIADSFNLTKMNELDPILVVILFSVCWGGAVYQLTKGRL